MDNKLKKQLADMGLKSSDAILMHSSLKGINHDAYEIIDTLKIYFSEGLVLMPTHTWRQMNETNTYFNVSKEPSCVGLLTELFRTSKDVYRSNHPTHSMAGFGNNALSYLSHAENDLTPCSPKGAWGRLSDIDATILLVGCGLERNTFVHAIEEKLDVPNRFTEKQILFTIDDGNHIYEKPFYKHFNARFAHLSENYVIMHDDLIKEGIIKQGMFGDAPTLYMKAKELETYVLKLLNKNINHFTEI